MTNVVTQTCIRCKYTDCVEVCPHQAVREGTNFVVIDPTACANCWLCELVCPVDAIKPDYALSPTEFRLKALNAERATIWPRAGKRSSDLIFGKHTYVLVNGAVAFEGEAGKLGEDRALQARLLGVVHDEESTSFAEELIA